MGKQLSTIPLDVSSRQNSKWRRSMDVKSKLAEDVRKLTSAASKLRLHKRKDKVVQTKGEEKQVKESFQEKSPEQEDKQRTEDTTKRSETKVQEKVIPKPAPLPNKATKGLPHHIVAATRVERKWTLTDLLQNLGIFVQKQCTHLHTIPAASEVAMWVRCADRALQLNGWTINSFLLESHVVFSFMLLSQAFEQYTVRTLADVKELVLLCLYVSYTYNANEISYPLRPFLVKQDRVAFWDKCMKLSLGASCEMLRLNKDHSYYLDTLSTLKQVSSLKA